jgi:hypothetical protein
MGRELADLNAEARDLRSRLHADGLARRASEDFARVADGRHARLTGEGVTRLYRWAYSDAFDPLIDESPVAQTVEAAAEMYARLLSEWQVAYPPPILATTAAMLCETPEERRERCLDGCAAIVAEWDSYLRHFPADRVLIAAIMAMESRDRQPPLDAAECAEQYQEILYDHGLLRERETLWSGAFLRLRGFPEERLKRVHEMWKCLVSGGWSMGQSTYPHAARLALVRGKPVEVASRSRRIFAEMTARILFEEDRACLVAASVLGHSDLYPSARETSADFLQERSVYSDMVARMMTLADRLTERAAAEQHLDCAVVAASILARMPGSVERVWEVFAETSELLRNAAADALPDDPPTDADPLLGAALLLCDRAWQGHTSNRDFAFEACAACRNEAWDPMTVFRLRKPSPTVWDGRGIR